MAKLVKLLTRDGYEIGGWGDTFYPVGPQENFVRVFEPKMRKDGLPHKASIKNWYIYLKPNPSAQNVPDR